MSQERRDPGPGEMAELAIRGTRLDLDDLLCLAAFLDIPYRTPAEVAAHGVALRRAVGQVASPPPVSEVTGRLVHLREDDLCRDEPAVDEEGRAAEAWRLTGRGLCAFLHGVDRPVRDATRCSGELLLRYLLLKNLRVLGRDPLLRRHLRRTPRGRFHHLREAREICGGEEPFRALFDERTDPVRYLEDQLAHQEELLAEARAEQAALEELAGRVEADRETLMEASPAEVMDLLGLEGDPSHPRWESEVVRAILLRQPATRLEHVQRPRALELEAGVEWLEELLAREDPPPGDG